MRKGVTSRRRFLKLAGAAGAGMFGAGPSVRLAAALALRSWGLPTTQPETGPPDYTLRIEASAIEIAPKRIVSAITYNGQFPGPLLRFKEGQAVTVDVHNDTDTPEQLHWHGQIVLHRRGWCSGRRHAFYPGAWHAPDNLLHGRRVSVSITRTIARAPNLHAGQYSGQVGPVYIEPKNEPGSYDQEVFLVLKEFEPSLSQGGDMAQDFLAPATRVKELETAGRVLDESVTRKRDAARLRSRLSLLHN